MMSFIVLKKGSHVQIIGNLSLKSCQLLQQLEDSDDNDPLKMKVMKKLSEME